MKRFHNIWTEARRIIESGGYDFDDTLEYFENFGYIYQGPHFVVLAEIKLVDYGKPKRKVLTWHVFLAIGKSAVRHFINAMPYWVPYFSFARPERNRHELATFRAERVCQKFGIDPSHLKNRKP